MTDLVEIKARNDERLTAIAEAAASYWICTRGQQIGGDAIPRGRTLAHLLIEAGLLAPEHCDFRFKKLEQAARPQGDV